MIDKARRLIFIHIARTGGTSVETALVGQDWWNIDPLTKHISASQTHQLYGEEIWGAFKKFSTVRNPWDRVVSMWATGWWTENNVPLEDGKSPTLREFVKKLQPHPNEKYNSLHYHNILDEKLDFILRYEHLQHDFSAMLKASNLPDIVLPHLEGRTHGHYRTYFDDDTAAIIESLFKKDIQEYGYTF
ncbi:MAG: sulfotransferase family 2 domain-containing protein [Methyloglobulus sp.]